jgi:hypothetical protein
MAAALARTQPYVIDSAEIQVNIQKDSSLLVTEQFDVTFNEPRRGIFRLIPFEFDTGRGLARRTNLGRVSVTDDQGRPLTTKVTTEGAYLRVRIGDADITLPPGTKQSYVLRYRVDNALNWFDGDQGWGPYAELYWNATGNQWDTSFGSVRIIVNHPTVEEGRGTRARVFVGAYGSRAYDEIDNVATGVVGPTTGAVMSKHPGGFTFLLSEPLPPYTGATVVVALPEGTVERPTAAQKAAWALLANLGFATPLVVLAAMFAAWRKYGRDPSPQTIAVQFEAPDGLTASQCGALLDNQVDQRDVAAAMISLAVSGHIVIRPVEGGFLRRRQVQIEFTGGGDESKLSDFELQILRLMQTCGKTVTESELQSVVGPEISSLKEGLFKSLVARGLYRHSPTSSMGCGCVAGLGLTALLTFFGVKVLSNGADTVSWVLGAVLCVPIVVVFAMLMPARTLQGARTREKVAGLYEAIRGRKHYMEWVADKELVSAKYEEMLPYAMAFGLVSQWADTFREVNVAQPSWYLGPSADFNLATFSRDLNIASTSLATAAMTPPRTASSSGSSGFSSGGGFSGGGFGGGGGGSW